MTATTIYIYQEIDGLFTDILAPRHQIFAESNNRRGIPSLKCAPIMENSAFSAVDVPFCFKSAGIVIPILIISMVVLLN